MAQTEKKKPLVTPKGIAMYPKLTQPDTKFKPEGEYSIKMKFTEADAEQLIKTIDVIFAEAYPALCKEQQKPGKPLPKLKLADPYWKPELDNEDNPTGFILMSFKQKASGKDPKDGREWRQAPTVFDAKGASLMKSVPNVGGGSIVKVAFHAKPFYMNAQVGAGISLKLVGVQILELKEYGDRNAASFGFGEEDGFDGSTTQEETFDSAGVPSEAKDESSDF